MSDEKKKPAVRYFKLSKTAHSFYDPISKLKVPKGSEKTPGVAKLEGKITTKVQNGIKHSHLKEATQKEYDAWIASQKEQQGDDYKEPNSNRDFRKMNKDQLVAYYKETYEVTEDDIKEFQDLKKEKMIELLLDEDDE